MVEHGVEHEGGRGPHRGAPRWIACGTIALALLVGMPATAQDDEEDGARAYVNTLALHLRAGPGTKSKIVSILLKYDPILVRGQEQVGKTTWYAIETAGGYANGWVAARYVDFGDPPSALMPEELDYGARETPTLMRGAHRYVGTAACRECHEDSTGDFSKGAVEVWEGHAHSQAFDSLGRDYTRVIAQRMRDVADPATDWRCVKCHVTAFGADPAQRADSYRDDEGVTCEVCHGPGGDYADADHGPGNPEREALGFRVLRNLDERDQVCTSCHNPLSPTFKPFNLLEFSRAIAHWVDAGDSAYLEFAARAGQRREDRVQQVASAQQAEQTQLAAAAEQAAAERLRLEADAEAERRAAERRAAAEAKAAEKRTAKAESGEEKARAEAEAKSAAKAAEEAAAAASAAAAAKAEAAMEAEAKAKAAAREAAAAEAKRRAEREAEAARERAELERRVAEQAKRDAERKAEQERAAAEAVAAAESASGTAAFLDEVDERLTLNTDGDKYKPFEFAHHAHASGKYVPDGDCLTCHHMTEEGDEPEPCSSCHEIDGDAEETSKKTKAAHSKKHPFPKRGDQEQTSCIGCHKSMNALLRSGKRVGEVAPTKCTGCHEKQPRG